MENLLLKQLYSAFNTLEDLIVNSATSEAQCQEWFEKNTIIFKLLNYTQYIPHPSQISCTNGEEYIPDFLVKKFNGVWEIFELKRPDTKVLKNKSRRVTFYSSFEDYISQCREYSQYYLIPDNRKTIEDKHGVELQEELNSFIIAGKDEGFNKLKVHDLLFDRGSKVQVLTYDDIKGLLLSSISLQTTHLEDLPGLTYSSMLYLPCASKGKFQYICDFGITEDKNRISIGITESEFLFIKIISDEGKVLHKTAALEEIGITYKKIFHLHFEFGLAENSTYLNVFVDGNFIFHDSYEKINLHPSVFYFWVLGSDMFGKTDAHQSYSQVIMFNKTLSVEERIDVVKYYLETYRPHYVQETLGPFSANFSGRGFLRHHKHPNFTDNVDIPNTYPQVYKNRMWCWYCPDKRRLFIDHPFFDKYYCKQRKEHPELIGTYTKNLDRGLD